MCGKNNIKLNVNGVNITLTEDQLKEIDKQRGNITHYTQIDSYASACRFYNIECDEENTSPEDQIKLIAKAVNSLISNEKFPVWKNKKQNKHYPYFEVNDKGCLVFDYSGFRYGFDGQVGFFKTSEAATHIGKTCISIYQKMADQQD